MGRFGVPTLTFLVVANMVGAGVFTTSGYTMGTLGSPGRVIAAWILGGLIALAGAVSFGRLVRAMPESGGEYLFLARAAHPLLGFIAGWVSLIAGFTGAIAFAASTLESYLVPEGARPGWLPTDAVAVTVVIIAAFLHGRGPRAGAIVQNVAVASKLVLLVGVLLFATATASDQPWNGLAADPGLRSEVPSGLGPTIALFASALVWISLSYSGFNAGVYVAGEVRNPERSVPRALVLGTGITTVLYVALNAFFVCAPPPAEIANQPDVAAIAAHWVGGASFSGFVRAIIALALVTSVSSLLMAGPRVYAKMADDGFLPQALRFRENRPFVATLFQSVLAIVFVLVSTIQGLLSYLGLTLSVCAAATVICLLLPHVRRHPLRHPSHWIPIFYVVATIGAGTIRVIDEPVQALTAVGTFAVGAVMYWARPRGRAHREEASVR